MNRLSFLLLLTSFYGVGLHAQTSDATLDSIALTFKKEDFDTPDSLSRAIVKSLKTDRDKYRAIFTWIAHNVSYDYKKYKNPGNFKPKIEAASMEEAMRKYKEWQEKSILRTYRVGKGICGDYALLFKKMCAAVELPCELIKGEARNSFYKRRKWESHGWNAIQVEGNWHLVDVTWGAGYVNEDTEQFHFRFSPGFFMPPPNLFVVDHLPDEDKWQLLEVPLDKKEVRNKPMFNYGHPKYGVEDFKFKNSKTPQGVDML